MPDLSIHNIRQALTALDNISLRNVEESDLIGLASVLVPLQWVNDKWQLVLTRRSSALRYHSGEVAFPGGMWEPGDEFPVDTALRESEEEIALKRQSVELLGALQVLQTRRKTLVTPVVAVIDHPIDLIPNDAEIESIFTVPLSFFMNDQRLRTDIFTRERSGQPHQHWVPAYEYDYQGERYEIWGFTAAVIVQLLNCGFGAQIRRANNAKEKIW